MPNSDAAASTDRPEISPLGPGLPPAPGFSPPNSSLTTGFQNQTTARKDLSAKSSIGRSIGGLLVASVVAGVCSVVWLIVAMITQSELGIVAWAIGGAIGLVAGLIGRNSSTVYCGLVAGIAVMSVLTAKVIMAAALIAMSWGANMMMDLADMNPERQKLMHAMADQMLMDGKFEGKEKQYAENYVSSFFSGTEDADDVFELMNEEMFEVAVNVDERIGVELDAKSPQEQQQLLVAARARHPEWIEDNNHYLAVIEQMLDEEGTLNNDLAAHAKSELASLDESWDNAYYESVAPLEIKKRRVELRTLAAERISNMDESQRDQAVRDTLERHLGWIPYPDAYTAMMEQMQSEGAFAGPLSEHAKATVESELTDIYPEYFEEISEEEMETREKELRSAVNQELVSKDAASRAKIIEETKNRYPDWYVQSMTAEDMKREMEEALGEIDTDGTFWGSFRAVFGFFDLLWLFLGASTAFGTAYQYGARD